MQITLSRDSIPKNSRLSVKIREVNVKSLKESLERQEIEEELRYFRMYDLQDDLEVDI